MTGAPAQLSRCSQHQRVASASLRSGCLASPSAGRVGRPPGWYFPKSEQFVLQQQKKHKKQKHTKKTKNEKHKKQKTKNEKRINERINELMEFPLIRDRLNGIAGRSGN